jgi:hypothetical protein
VLVMTVAAPVAATLADAIRTELAAAKDAAASAVDHACRAGELLIQAKESCSHGEWGAWLHENTEISERTARVYMQLARRWRKLPEAERQRVAVLPLRQALIEGARPGPTSKRSLAEFESEGRRLAARVRGLAAWFDVADREEDIDSLAQIAQDVTLENEICAHRLHAHRELGRLIPELKADLAARFPGLSSRDQTRLFNDLVSGRLVPGAQPEAMP